jgi:hypothetical protein
MLRTFFFWASAGGGTARAQSVNAVRTARRAPSISDNRGRTWFHMGIPPSAGRASSAEDDDRPGCKVVM